MAVLTIRTVMTMIDNLPLGRFNAVFTLFEAAEALTGKKKSELQKEMPVGAWSQISHIDEICFALYQALLNRELKTALEEIGAPPIEAPGPEERVDYNAYVISRKALIEWAHSQGMECPFDVPDEDSVKLYNPNHPCYSPEIHAIHLIQERVANDECFQMCQVSVVKKCLSEIAPHFSKEQKKRIITQFNTKKKGGAPNTELQRRVKDQLNSIQYFDESVRVHKKE